MDITRQLYIFLIVLVAMLCAFVAKETIYSKRLPQGGALAEQTGDYSKSFTDKVLSLSEEQTAAHAAEQEPVLPTVRGTRMFISGGLPGGAMLDEPAASAPDKSAKPSPKKRTPPALPFGFSSKTINDYLVYREELPITKQLQDFLGDIHGNFVLDILPFSIAADFNRIFVMMFRHKEKYSQITTQPQWSVAATDIPNQAIYIVETSGFKGNFVHELTHIYYDGFFRPHFSPLWMSEGMAVRMQSFAQTEGENAWLNRAQQKFTQGSYMGFDEFTGNKDLSRYNNTQVLDWYAQAYSVIDYLLRDKTRDEFYQFSSNIKSGMPLEKAMYRAYGMPFNTTSALEYAWQHNLQQREAR